jgi:vacuolar-type H+-ATPase subunit F/Vma7
VKKIGAIGDRLTLLYLELAGIKTVIEAEDPQEALKQVNDLIRSKEYGIIIISSQLHNQISEEIKEIQEKRQIPIITEIQGMTIREAD